MITAISTENPLEGDTEYTSEFKNRHKGLNLETGIYFCNLDWNVYVLPFLH